MVLYHIWITAFISFPFLGRVWLWFYFISSTEVSAYFHLRIILLVLEDKHVTHQKCVCFIQCQYISLCGRVEGNSASPTLGHALNLHCFLDGCCEGNVCVAWGVLQVHWHNNNRRLQTNFPLSWFDWGNFYNSNIFKSSQSEPKEPNRQNDNLKLC